MDIRRISSVTTRVYGIIVYGSVSTLISWNSKEMLDRTNMSLFYKVVELPVYTSGKHRYIPTAFLATKKTEGRCITFTVSSILAFCNVRTRSTAFIYGSSQSALFTSAKTKHL